MLFIGVIITGILAFQTIQTAICPATLRAVAAIQAHRARAIANALRARTHYNALRARTNLGLLDHRVIRNTGNEVLNDSDLDYDEDNLPFLEEDYEEINLPGGEEDISGFLPLDINLQGDRNDLGRLVGANEEFVNPERRMEDLGPDIPCAYSDLRDNSNPQDFGTLQVPLRADNSNDLSEIQMNYGGDDRFSQKRREIGALGCQRPFDQTNSLLENTPFKNDPTVGMQATYPPQAFAAGQPPFGQPQFGQPVLIPWQFMSQNIPTMQMIPQMNPYANFPLQPLSSLQPGSPMIFLRQAPYQDIDETKPHVHEKSSSGQTVGSSNPASPNVGTSGHTHTYTHSHTHFREPHRATLVPNTQIVTPGINLHVIQNQNARVTPQQIPSVVVQPGLNPTGAKFIQTSYDIHNPVPTSAGYRISDSQIIENNANRQHLIVPSTTSFAQSQNMASRFGNSQSQVFQTNVPNNRHYLITPNAAATSFTQSQTMHQGRSNDNPFAKMELYSNLDENNEKVGTIMTDFRMRAPEQHFDPSKPQNFQQVVNYIEGQGDIMKRLIQSIENDEKLRSHYEGPLNLNSNSEYVRFPSQFEAKENSDNVKLGTIPLENIEINPPPTLPENFPQLNFEERQEAMNKYLQEEQENFNNVVKQVDENTKRAFDKLSGLIEVAPAFMANSAVPNNNEDNINKIQSEITGRSQYNMNSERSSDLSRDTRLGHIIDIPKNSESEWYQRLARSPNKTTDEKLDNLLLTEKEIVNELKKDAKHDEDLMMIGYIGENMINDLEKKKNETSRPKRSIGGIPYHLPLNRLITDPRTTLDIPRTLDNLGAVVKNTFEHENAPLYHVRNMMGSAQDAMLATMKIPTQNFLIPSQYDIVRRQENNALLGDINPNLFSKKYSQNQGHVDPATNTFHKVGSAIRGGVLSGQEALSHVGQVANNAKNAIHSTRYIAPRLQSQHIPAVATKPIRKTVLIAPRILDVANDDRVGNVLDTPQGQFVKVGYLLDAIGVSNPNYDDVHLEKIIIEPKMKLSGPSDMLGNMLMNVRVEDYTEDGDNFIGDTMSTLDKVKESLKVDNLKELLDKAKTKLNVLLENANPMANTKHNEHIRHEIANQHAEMNDAHLLNAIEPQVHNPLQTFTTNNHVDQNQEVVEATLIPDSLLHPFMGHFTQKDVDAQQFKDEDENEKNRRLGQILGAINPVMFEKLVNESLKTETNSETALSIDDYDEDIPEKDNNDEELGTNMKFSQAMLKPFMGQASDKQKDKFFHKYVSDTPKTEDKTSEQKGTTEKSPTTEESQWVEVDFNKDNGLELEE